jgi:mannose-6-phosphate isomerase-like protein (cupin superfamily)
MRRVDKPWGYEDIWAETDRYVAKVLFIRTGEGLSLQYHRVKDETIMLWSGRMRFESGPEGGALEIRELAAGEIVRIQPHTLHRMTAITDCQVLEVSTPELDDVVRLEDRYGRV